MWVRVPPSAQFIISAFAQHRHNSDVSLSTQNPRTLDVQISVSNMASPVERRLSSKAYRSQASASALHMTLGFDTALRCAQSLFTQRS
jgi:hypothetical protein